MGKYYRVYADVELGNIESNVEALMALTPAGTKSLAVVKADGYGHGCSNWMRRKKKRSTGSLWLTIFRASFSAVI